MSAPLHFEDLNVGDTWQSRARTITETDVVNFACITGDFDPLHVDHPHAEESPFHKPIAHGLLGLSFMAGLSSTCPAVRTVAFVSLDQWKFLKPIYFGDTVRVLTEVVEKQPQGRRMGRITWKRQLVNQDGQVVQEGMLVTLVACAAAQVRGADKAVVQPIHSAFSNEPMRKTGS